MVKSCETIWKVIFMHDVLHCQAMRYIPSKSDEALGFFLFLFVHVHQFTPRWCHNVQTWKKPYFTGKTDITSNFFIKWSLFAKALIEYLFSIVDPPSCFMMTLPKGNHYQGGSYYEPNHPYSRKGESHDQRSGCLLQHRPPHAATLGQTGPIVLLLFGSEPSVWSSASHLRFFSKTRIRSEGGASAWRTQYAITRIMCGWRPANIRRRTVPMNIVIQFLDARFPFTARHWRTLERRNRRLHPSRTNSGKCILGGRWRWICCLIYGDNSNEGFGTGPFSIIATRIKDTLWAASAGNTFRLYRNRISNASIIILLMSADYSAGRLKAFIRFCTRYCSWL